MAPILILGIGNILLRDEGVGVRVVEALQRSELPVGVEVVDGGTAGADLIDLIADRRAVIVIDAVDAGAEPGAIFRFTGQDLVEGARAKSAVSLHEFGLLELLGMADRLECAPGQVVIFGIQPKDVRPGLELSPEVAAVLPAVVELVVAEAAS